MSNNNAPKIDTLPEFADLKCTYVSADDFPLGAKMYDLGRKALELFGPDDTEAKMRAAAEAATKAELFRWLVAEIDCRIQHGADSNGHLDGLLLLLAKRINTKPRSHDEPNLLMP